MYRLEHGFHLLFTLGLAWVLQECVILYLGPVGVNVAMPTLLSGVIVIGDFFYPAYRLFLIIFGIVLAVAIWFLLERTRLGSVIRAGCEQPRSEEHTSELQSLMSTSYAVFCLKK